MAPDKVIAKNVTAIKREFSRVETLASVKLAILMITRMNFAFSAIILGLNFLNLTQFSSHKIGDYNSCNLENTKENCTKCDNT